MDMNALMRQAQNMQRQMEKKQKEVEAMEFNVSTNGGAINITIMGNKKVTKIEIDPDLLDADNQEMLQDMLVIAVNEAIQQVEKAMSEAMSGATGGMGFPGMF